MKNKLFDNKLLKSHITTDSVGKGEKWLGYLLGPCGVLSEKIPTASQKAVGILLTRGSLSYEGLPELHPPRYR